MKVLVVDDSLAMRKMIQATIRKAGIAVDSFVEAGDGLEALAALKQGPVDLVLTDVNMPNMDGEEFVKAKQQEPSIQGIPVIVVTTDSTTDRVREMIGRGAAGYVVKPFKPEDLRSELKRVLGIAA